MDLNISAKTLAQSDGPQPGRGREGVELPAGRAPWRHLVQVQLKGSSGTGPCDGQDLSGRSHKQSDRVRPERFQSSQPIGCSEHNLLLKMLASRQTDTSQMQPSCPKLRRRCSAFPPTRGQCQPGQRLHRPHPGFRSNAGREDEVVSATPAHRPFRGRARSPAAHRRAALRPALCRCAF